MAPGAIEIGAEQGLLSAAAIFILLRAFANGGSSLTGLEAIADGVGLFKSPESVNAKKTLVMMSLILGSLVLGVSYFAHRILAVPYESETPTVISQVASTILGDGAFGSAFFILVQAATMLILFAGANTTFSAFPIVVNYAAADGYLPKCCITTRSCNSGLSFIFSRVLCARCFYSFHTFRSRHGET
jgi:hypothetical protein